MFNRTKKYEPEQWISRSLGGTVSAGCFLWCVKEVQVLVSNERIRDVQMNVLFACLHSSHAQISSRFGS